MNIVKIKEAKKEITRFLSRIKELEMRYKQDGDTIFYGCKETSAVKRTSLDLSRILTELRK